ncbi:MAG: tetratricopeptide repeat protein [Alphaproteobacteria bacterium]|nr:tetratricopeptide repeat protein [Alphaproteobacteria bacterium]
MALDIQTAFATAIAHQKAGRIGKAEAVYRRILQAHPEHPDALHLLGLLRLHEGRPEEAVRLIGRAVAANEGVAPYHFNLASAHAALEDFAAAAVHYEKALALRPDHLGARNNLAIALIELGRIEEGVEHFEAVLAAEPGHAEAHNNLGNALSQLGRYHEALAGYRRALELEPDFADALNNLGKLYLDRGNNDEAARQFEKCLTLDPENADARRRLREARSRLVPLWHFPMLNDEARNDAYRRAIERAVTPEAVVLDIGAGSGLLAMIAARAGARQVVSCEMVAPIAETAREIIARNGLADRIALIAKRSTDLRLGEDMAERADVLIHEIFDDGLLGELVVPVVELARAHLAKPDAVVLPRAATVYASLVESAELAHCNRVTEACGFDVEPFNSFAESMPVGFRLKDFAHRRLSDPVEVLRFDFAGPPIRAERRRVEIPARAAGALDLVALWFRIELDEEISVDTGPDAEGTHWKQVLQIFPAATPVQTGEAVAITVAHDRQHIWIEPPNA